MSGMTLAKATEIMTTYFVHKKPVSGDDIWNACLLGREALRRLREHREEHIDIGFRLLPGETKE